MSDKYGSPLLLPIKEIVLFDSTDTMKGLEVQTYIYRVLGVAVHLVDMKMDYLPTGRKLTIKILGKDYSLGNRLAASLGETFRFYEISFASLINRQAQQPSDSPITKVPNELPMIREVPYYRRLPGLNRMADHFRASTFRRVP